MLGKILIRFWCADSAARTMILALTNSGSADLSITNIASTKDSIFSPQALDSISASISVASNAAGSPLTGSVSGTGHTLINEDFSNTTIRRAIHDVERVRVYNFEVAECHTYFVGELGIWVHNKGEEVVGISAIRDVTSARFIYGELDFQNKAKTNSNQITGVATEALGLDAMVASTGLPFRENIRNASNNGPDLWYIIPADAARGVPGQIML